MNESAAAKARLSDGPSVTSPRGASAINQQLEGPARTEQSSSSNLVAQDVRSIVEQQFNRMNEAHDRIRSEELALRLAATGIKQGL